ncbi:glycosyltransferase family 39 protein [Aureispira anguillae]|uniref:Glycosyltransferase family 39 protein n=1 Tax=Aureispira anguillae TaxID=2864201 RepID=A0A915YJU3_9BACT|nr:glycosyltransferase family 39 protein [Aureispira anguillae]BDS14251.1 glycosyltransferase family 39 protein [Aureispira anguillae]
MNKSLKQQNSWSIDYILIFLCVLVGIVLRVGNPVDWSFINDELSTWAKVSYDSVGAVIENIKLVDSHPVGMYVFVYYWTGIFGTSEWAIKLPFLLMSIASMVLVHRVAALWFSKTVALLALAYFATLQFPIWWSHIARQYQSGLFCTLVMVYCWTQLLVLKQDKKRYWLGFVVMGAAAMYNHYFSLLFAALIGLSGFFWISKEQLLKYLGSGILMVLLFVPHISITTYQLLHADGHLWYNIPTPSFISNHIFYLFHYSYWCLGLMLVLTLGSILLYGKTMLGEKNKMRCLALCWFLTPLIFGYLYSVYQSPILRESHLLFSFPYLLFVLLSFVPDRISTQAKAGMVLLILIVNSTTLITTRRHYDTVHTHPYEHFIKHSQAFLEAHNREDVTIVLGENPQYLQYYKTAYQANFEHQKSFKPPIPFLEFREIVQNSVTSHLILGSLPEAYIRLARDYYPYLYQKSYGINYEYYILSKEKALNKTAWEIDFESEMTFDVMTKQQGWTGIVEHNLMKDTERSNVYYRMLEEWGPTFEMDLAAVTPRNNQFLDIALDIRVEDSIAVQPRGVLVLELRDQQDSLLVWKGVDATAQTVVKQGWQRMYLSVRFAHEKIYDNVKKLKMKAFFWNREKQAILLDRFSITSHKGNEILYGDTNNFE